MNVCCCSSPDCLANGCAQARRHSQGERPWTHPIGLQPWTPGPGQTVCEVPLLREDDIRRIVREELIRAGVVGKGDEG